MLTQVFEAIRYRRISTELRIPEYKQFIQIQLCNLSNIYSQKIRDNYVIYACIYHRNNHRKLHIHVSPYMLRSRHIDYIFFLVLLLPSVLIPSYYNRTFYSTVTTFAKLRGISGFNPRDNDSSYDSNCNGIIVNKSRYVLFIGILI